MIPDITTGQRTYFLAVSSASNFVADIPFRDTAGNIINCNYIKIDSTTNGAGSNGCYVAELSGLSRVGNMTLNSLSACKSITNFNGSGILGIGCAFGGGTNGTSVWHGSNGEICNGIKLQLFLQGAGASVIVSITYGNLIPYNVLRSDMYDKGR